MPRPGFNKFSIKLVVASTCLQKSALWQEFFPALSKVGSSGVLGRTDNPSQGSSKFELAGELPANVR
jgi:hypothetical protein